MGWDGMDVISDEVVMGTDWTEIMGGNGGGEMCLMCCVVHTNVNPWPWP